MTALTEAPPCKGPAPLAAFAPDAPIDEIMAAFQRDGAVIISRFLTPDQVRDLNADLDVVFGATPAGAQIDDEWVQAFHGPNTKRATNLITRCPAFREHVIDRDILHDVADATFREESGDWWLCTAQAIEIGPNSPAQILHRDCGNNPPIAALGPDGPEVISNFFLALTDFTLENGATRIIPGSHRVPFTESHDGAYEQSYYAPLRAGDVVFFGGKTIHGGGANVTRDQYRRSISMSPQPAWITPEEAYPFLIPMELVRTLSPRVQKMIGFRSVYPKGTPGLWQSDAHDIAGLLRLDEPATSTTTTGGMR